MSSTYPLVNVTTIFANPFSLPIHSCFFGFCFLLCVRLLLSKDIQTCARRRRYGSGRCYRWGNHRRTDDKGGCCRKRQTNESQEKGDDGGKGFHDDIVLGRSIRLGMMMMEFNESINGCYGSYFAFVLMTSEQNLITAIGCVLLEVDRITRCIAF